MKLLHDAIKAAHYKILKLCWSSIVEGYKKEYKDALGYIGNQVEKTVKHGDKITLKSTAHQGHRLQDHGNKLAKFENKNRGGWKQLLVEKCGFAGIGDNQGCW